MNKQIYHHTHKQNFSKSKEYNNGYKDTYDNITNQFPTPSLNNTKLNEKKDLFISNKISCHVNINLMHLAQMVIPINDNKRKP